MGLFVLLSSCWTPFVGIPVTEVHLCSTADFVSLRRLEALGIYRTAAVLT
jgi:hypothetical protein